MIALSHYNQIIRVHVNIVGVFVSVFESDFRCGGVEECESGLSHCQGHL